MPRHVSSKTFGHEVGLSVCFRQWRATHSHCQFLHGYALAVHLEFEAERLDDRGWVVDFGDLGTVRQWLKDQFDHRTVVAEDDPLLPSLQMMEEKGLCQLTVLQAVGCEAFAAHIAHYVQLWLRDHANYRGRVRLAACKVSEHGANHAEIRP